jgi:hypothetical protein
MTNAIDIHAKSRGRTELERLTGCARVFLGDSLVRLKQSPETERLFVLDLAPTDVATDHVQGPMLMGTLPDERLLADLAAPCRYVRQQFGKLQTLGTSTDLSKLKRPAGGGDGAAPLRVNPRVALTSFKSLEHAYDVSVPPEVLQNADRDLGEALGIFAREVWRLQREYRAATLLSTNTSWATAQRVTGATWSSGNPIADLYKALAVAANPRPNLWILPENVSQSWFDNSHVQAFMQSGGLERLGIRVVVGSTKTTVAGVLKDVWATGGNNAMLVRTGSWNGDGDEVELTTAATARWETDNHGMIPKDERWIEADGVLLRTFWDKHTGARGICSAVLVVNEDVVMVDSTLGAIVTGVA